MYKTLDDFDSAMERRSLSSLMMDFSLAQRQGLAEQAALKRHQVSDYVLNLPIESSKYPAIEYFRLAKQVNMPIQEVYNQIQEGKTVFYDRSGNPFFFRPEYHEYIDWTFPGHDTNRPKEKGCGFIRSKEGGIVYSMCPDHPEHFIKGKRRHCWSLHCPECFNDEALRQGVESERPLLRYAKLIEKQSGQRPEISHWVVSPPQELAKSLMQTKQEFDDLFQTVIDDLQACGARAGTTIFHSHRQKQTEWQLAPHFHSLLYGRIKTNKFRRLHPGWIIKKVHPHERINSIRHTLAYLFTHMGLGVAEKDPDDIDWDMELLNLLIPGIKSGKGDYRDKDFEDEFLGKGRLVGDLSDVDWEQWTMSKLYLRTRLREWGGVGRNKIKKVAVHRQYKIRRCSECGELLRVYDGIHDTVGNYVRYIQDVEIVCFAHHHSVVMTTFLQFKERLKANGQTPSDFAKSIPFAISDLELTKQNNDLVMSGPFAEPDEFFLRRQAMAYSRS